MIKLNQYINENLILEAIVSSVEGYKIKFDLGEHAFDRKSDRETKYNEYISSAEILYSLYKVSKNIRDDFNENIIKFGDKILIFDKSRSQNYFALCEIQAFRKDQTYISLKLITHMYKKKHETFYSNDIKKTYTTYISDKDVEKRYKLKQLL